MTKVVIEAAALADALKKAEKVAPTRGEAFEKAAGVLVEVGKDEVVIKATDNLTRYATWLTPESVEGEPVTWRLPSKVFSDIIGRLKTERNKTVVLEQISPTKVQIQHGKTTKCQLILMDNEERPYPNWMPFSPDDMTPVEGLGGVAASVQWAASKGTDVPFTGIHFDGNTAMCTDKYRFAVAPCLMKVSKPITLPAGTLSQVLRPNETVLVRQEGSQFYIMPDEFTQISLTVYGLEWPPALSKVLKRDYPRKVKVNKTELLDMLQLAATMVGSERLPTMIMTFGVQKIIAMMENEQIGVIGHIVDVPGQCDWPRHEIRFKPEFILGALEGCPGQEVTLAFDPEAPRGAFYIDSGSGLEFWLAPRQRTEPGAGGES